MCYLKYVILEAYGQLLYNLLLCVAHTVNLMQSNLLCDSCFFHCGRTCLHSRIEKEKWAMCIRTKEKKLSVHSYAELLLIRNTSLFRKT